MAPDEAAVNETQFVKAFAVADQDDYTLLRLWSGYHESVATLQRLIQVIEADLFQRLKDRGATAIDDPDFECVLKATISYDTSLVVPLKEIVDPDVLKDNGWTPAHEETVQVAESFNMTRIKKLLKFGDDVKRVIEAAQVTGPSRLVIKAKKKKDGV